MTLTSVKIASIKCNVSQNEVRERQDRLRWLPGSLKNKSGKTVSRWSCQGVKVNREADTVLVSFWKALKPEQQSMKKGLSLFRGEHPFSPPTHVM